MGLAYSLVIGVIGGGSPDCAAPWLGDAVRRALAGARRALPAPPHTPVQLCVLTNLTGGLDALVVEAARSLDAEAQVRVVLPMLRDECRDLLPPHLGPEMFQKLLELDPQPLALRRELLDLHYDEDRQAEARLRARAMAEEFVIDHSDLVLALPVPTAGAYPDTRPYAAKVGCPLCVLRQGGAADMPDVALHGHAAKLLWHLEAFNRGLAAKPVADRFLLPHMRALRGEAGGLISAEWADFLAHRLSPVFAYADQRAGHFQNLYHAAGVLVFGLALAAVLLVGFGVTFLGGPAQVFALEALLLLVITGLIFVADRVGSHRKWLAYRFLAERLRAGFFLGVGSLHPRRIYVPRRKGVDLDPAAWTHLAVDALASQAPKPAKLDGTPYQGLADFIEDAWVRDQLDFHQSKWRKEHRWGHRLERWGARVFWLALAGALIHWAMHTWHLDVGGPHLSNGLTLGALALPFLGATLGALRNHREFKRHELRSRRMARTLNELIRSFELLTPNKVQYLLAKMEAASLAEAESWMQLMDAVTLEKA